MSCRSRHPRRWNQQHHRRRQPRGVPAADRQLVNFCFFSKNSHVDQPTTTAMVFCGDEERGLAPLGLAAFGGDDILRRVEAMRGVVMISDRWR